VNPFNGIERALYQNIFDTGGASRIHSMELKVLLLHLLQLYQHPLNPFNGIER